MDLTLLFFIAGSIILVGFLGDIIYEKIKIPDILVLIGIGILLGPVFKLVDHRHLTEFAEYFGTFALIVILFEGGMDIKIRMLLKELGNATLLVAVSFISTTAGITAFLLYARSWELMPSLLMAIVLGCTSAAIVLPVLSKMSLKDDTKTVLYVESAMSDVLAVVLAISLIEFVKLENIGIERPFQTIASSFSIAIVAGTAFGLFWYKALTVMANRKYSYMVTLGVMLIVVATVDFLGGSGPIAVLIFGIILGNCGDIPHLQTSVQCTLIDETIKFFHGEVTFFIRTFFFVYLGMLITVEALAQRNLVVSFSLLAIIVIMRYLSVEFMTRRTGKGKEEKTALFYMLPRGLATAVLASFPVSAGIDGSEGFIVYAVSVIILTNIVMTIGVLHLERKQVNHAKKMSSPKQSLSQRHRWLHKKYIRMFENIQDVYYEADMEGMILEVSPSVNLRFGWNEKEWLGTFLQDYLVERNQWDDLMMKLNAIPNIIDNEMTISIGVAAYLPPEDGASFIKRADENMYQAKKLGKNRVYFS